MFNIKLFEIIFTPEHLNTYYFSLLFNGGDVVADDAFYIAHEHMFNLSDIQDAGDFTTFHDSGEYRFKNFRITGITHSEDGKYSSLKLIEKL